MSSSLCADATVSKWSGIILYELLAGKVPYETRSAGLHEAVQAMREEDPVPPLPPGPSPGMDRATLSGVGQAGKGGRVAGEVVTLP